MEAETGVMQPRKHRITQSHPELEEPRGNTPEAPGKHTPLTPGLQTPGLRNRDRIHFCLFKPHHLSWQPWEANAGPCALLTAADSKASALQTQWPLKSPPPLQKPLRVSLIVSVGNHLQQNSC